MSDLLTFLALVIAFTLIASRMMQPFSTEERKLLWWSFAAHQFAGVANIWVARYYYGYGDMLSYHNDGRIIADSLRSDFWGLAPGLIGIVLHKLTPIPVPIEVLMTSSGSMQALAGFSAFFFFDSLYGTCAFIAGLAFFSKIALYLTVRAELPHLSTRALVWSCVLIPSVVFWSSALLKEPIALIGLFFALYGFQCILRRANRARAVAIVAMGLTIIYIVKPYILPVFGISAATWYLVRRLQSRGVDVVFRLWHVLVGGALALVAVVATGMLLPSFALDALRDQLASNQTAGATIEAGSNYSLGTASGSAAGQLALAPLALLTALFRPAVFEAKSALIFINALEMAVFTVAAIRVPFRRGTISVVTELFRHPFLSFCAVFTVTFGTFTGLGTTNLGALSRYRAPLVPFFAMLLFALLARPVEALARAAHQARKPAALPLGTS
jgi:hypothetical protein